MGQGYVFTDVCHSVNGGVPDTPPTWSRPPGTRYTPKPPHDQVYPPGPGTLPWDQVHPSGTRYVPQTRYTARDQVPPRPGTPPWTRYTPRDHVHPPGLGTPLQTRYTSLDQVHPPGPGTPPWDHVHPSDAEHAGRYGQ